MELSGGSPGFTTNDLVQFAVRVERVGEEAVVYGGGAFDGDVRYFAANDGDWDSRCFAASIRSTNLLRYRVL